MKMYKLIIRSTNKYTGLLEVPDDYERDDIVTLATEKLVNGTLECTPVDGIQVEIQTIPIEESK